MVKINIVASIILIIALFATYCESTKLGTKQTKCKVFSNAPTLTKNVPPCKSSACVRQLNSKWKVVDNDCCIDGVDCRKVFCVSANMRSIWVPASWLNEC